MNSSKKSLAWAHPLVQEWFLSKVGKPSKPQIMGWPAINAEKSTLIAAPTGSGKTLAAFLSCINNLVIQALENKLEDKTQVIYISPLKALSNDVQKNLIKPLEEITELAKKKNLAISKIKVGLRTGDTPAYERVSMVKKPPHILVTTPESLYILLTAKKSREILRFVNTVIVDEIHALAKDKRGIHLSLSLERLQFIAYKKITRIGLSATQKPIELVARFLCGSRRELPEIIDIGHKRERKLIIEVPKESLSAVATNNIWDEIYDRLALLAQSRRSTLIFANTRRLAERIAHNLSDRLGPDQVAAHHGSLSRTLRLDVETKLKTGQLKALVATASLELGIDIGELDLVCQIGSPRSIAVALQRVGRAGHWHEGISEGRFFATTRDELLECAALIKAIEEGALDALIMPERCLDILAQQLVAMCVTDSFSEKALFELVTQAYAYRDLSLQEFKSVLIMLCEGISGSRGRYGAYLFHDKVNDQISAKKHARIVAVSNGGAIADIGLFSVLAEPNNILVGTLDEDFAVESTKGDIILLGTTSWRIKRVESNAGKVFVEAAPGMAPSVPFWRGEAPGRSDELSACLSDLRREIARKLKDDPNFIETTKWLKSLCHIEEHGALQLSEYIYQGCAVLGAVPTQDTIIAERFFDEAGGMQLIIHSPFGARINKAWGLALRKKFCRSFNFELQASATDNGLNIALLEQHSFPLQDVFKFLNPKFLKEVLIQAVLQSPFFGTRWRFVAMRSLALVKFRNGKKMPPNILRMLSDDLLASVFPDAAACQDNLGGRDISLPDHPLVNEAMSEIFLELLDEEGLCRVLEKIDKKIINIIAIDTPLPSVFSHEILNANPYAFLDDAPLEERRARAVEMRRMLPNSVLSEIGALDFQVILDVKEQAWPDIRDANELHDSLQSFIAIPLSIIKLHNLEKFFEELVTQKRATWAHNNNTPLALAAETRKIFQAIYPNLSLEHELKDFDDPLLEREDALILALRHWMQSLGPTSSTYLSELLELPVGDLDAALYKLESTGLILRGSFTQSENLEWCERRLLARIHRLTVEKLRQEIRSSTAASFAGWLLRWQHVQAGSQLQGKKGLLEVIRQLQGFELPANAWEREIFKARVSDFDPDMLDHLALKGVVGWGRLSPHPALLKSDKKTVVARAGAPMSFFIREDAHWLIKAQPQEEDLAIVSPVARAIFLFLKEHGASFFHEILRGVSRLAYEVEESLWQLLAVGFITADDFDNLRLLNSKRRTTRGQSLRHSTGRWSILSHQANSQNNIEASARLLLNRYGVVFRDLLKRERNMPQWRDLLFCLRRLEDCGEIRGGRFVEGFAGEQFALPQAVESLRNYCKNPDKNFILNATDPLNLAGIILPGPRIIARAHKKIEFKNGKQILIQ